MPASAAYLTVYSILLNRKFTVFGFAQAMEIGKAAGDFILNELKMSDVYD
jgi:hypothetical protein